MLGVKILILIDFTYRKCYIFPFYFALHYSKTKRIMRTNYRCPYFVMFLQLTARQPLSCTLESKSKLIFTQAFIHEYNAWL